MLTSELDYHLPPELIATRAVEPRDSARLMVLRRGDPDFVEHRRVRDLPEYLGPRDLMVFNTTTVLPARLAGVRVGTGGKVGGLYLRPGNQPGRWIVLLRGGHLKPGARIGLLDRAGEHAGSPGGVELELLAKTGEEAGAWEVRVSGFGPGPDRNGARGGAARDVADDGADDGADDIAILARVGLTPLPPYILQARKERHEAVTEDEDRGRYQTVYAAADAAGSVAAPTAGLHFTPGLLSALAANGVQRAEVVLHVGTGTFRTVEVERLEDHPMHTEWCSMSPGAIRLVNGAKESGNVFAVGTTSARTLESYAGWIAACPGQTPPESIQTRILISPGHRWGSVDGMLTNFHLPRSTLLAMVAALLETEGAAGQGIKRLLAAYEQAKAMGYRFYSYGDAMLVLP